MNEVTLDAEQMINKLLLQTGGHHHLHNHLDMTLFEENVCDLKCEQSDATNDRVHILIDDTYMCTTCSLGLLLLIFLILNLSLLVEDLLALAVADEEDKRHEQEQKRGPAHTIAKSK